MVLVVKLLSHWLPSVEANHHSTQIIIQRCDARNDIDSCSSVWEGRKVNDLRRDNGVRSNGYCFWSALVLDEMLEASRAEYDAQKALHPDNKRLEPPIAVPPLSAYTSFFAVCHKLISMNDIHPSIKSDAASRAWSRWKEMPIHSVVSDVMAYGALMRIFAAQGRPEQALDLLDEIMMQMMMPVNAENILSTKDGGAGGEILKSIKGDDDGWPQWRQRQRQEGRQKAARREGGRDLSSSEHHLGPAGRPLRTKASFEDGPDAH